MSGTGERWARASLLSSTLPFHPPLPFTVLRVGEAEAGTSPGKLRGDTAFGTSPQVLGGLGLALREMNFFP